VYHPDLISILCELDSTKYVRAFQQNPTSNPSRKEKENKFTEFLMKRQEIETQKSQYEPQVTQCGGQSACAAQA
jgi:hypothetical protein